MPAWKGTLSERQIWEVVSYLRIMAGAAGKAEPVARGDMVSGLR
jgi:mono/diheme cytochrome c family protein